MQDANETLRALGLDDPPVGRVAGSMGAAATDGLARLDAAARSIRYWTPMLIPGLLQTSMYAAGAIKTWRPTLTIEGIQERVAARQRRKQAFLQRWLDPIGGEARFVIGEAAIVHPVCNEHAHPLQLVSLLNITQRYPRIVVQVLPPSIQTPGSAGPFSIHDLRGGPPVGHVESLIGGWYSTLPEDVATMHNAYSTLVDQAYTPADSRALISEVLHSCWGRTWETTTEQDSTSPATPTPTAASTWPAVGPSQ